MGIGKPDYDPPSNARRDQSKRLRREQSPAEKRLWRALRDCIPLRNTHFRRQVAVGNYIADFCAQGPKLIIEVDGEQHGDPNARAHDAERDRVLTQAGYRVLRFSAREVVGATTSVLYTIAAAIGDRYREGVRDPHP